MKWNAFHFRNCSKYLHFISSEWLCEKLIKLKIKKMNRKQTEHEHEHGWHCYNGAPRREETKIISIQEFDIWEKIIWRALYEHIETNIASRNIGTQIQNARKSDDIKLKWSVFTSRFKVKQNSKICGFEIAQSTCLGILRIVFITDICIFHFHFDCCDAMFVLIMQIQSFSHSTLRIAFGNKVIIPMERKATSWAILMYPPRFLEILLKDGNPSYFVGPLSHLILLVLMSIFILIESSNVSSMLNHCRLHLLELSNHVRTFVCQTSVSKIYTIASHRLFCHFF